MSVRGVPSGEGALGGRMVTVALEEYCGVMRNVVATPMSGPTAAQTKMAFHDGEAESCMVRAPFRTSSVPPRPGRASSSNAANSSP